MTVKVVGAIVTEENERESTTKSRQRAVNEIVKKGKRKRNTAREGELMTRVTTAVGLLTMIATNIIDATSENTKSDIGHKVRDTVLRRAVNIQVLPVDIEMMEFDSSEERK